MVGRSSGSGPCGDEGWTLCTVYEVLSTNGCLMTGNKKKSALCMGSAQALLLPPLCDGDTDLVVIWCKSHTSGIFFMRMRLIVVLIVVVMEA